MLKMNLVFSSSILMIFFFFFLLGFLVQRSDSGIGVDPVSPVQDQCHGIFSAFLLVFFFFFF